MPVGIERETLIEGRLFQRIRTNAKSPIDGGVLFYANDAAPIFVDFQNSPTLKSIYLELLKKPDLAKNSEKEVLSQLVSQVGQTFSHRDWKEIDRLVPETLYPHKPVSLEKYARAGAGACLQAALCETAILERICKTGLLPGLTILGYGDLGDSGKHWWSEYHGPSGITCADAIIIPAGFVGTKEEHSQILQELVEEMFS